MLQDISAALAFSAFTAPLFLALSFILEIPLQFLKNYLLHYFV